jgi:hypothetical protein
MRSTSPTFAFVTSGLNSWSASPTSIVCVCNKAELVEVQNSSRTHPIHHHLVLLLPIMSRSQRSQQPIISPILSIFHSASSRRLGKARASTPNSVASSSSTSSGVEVAPHELPDSDWSVFGEACEVDFERVSRSDGRLAARLGYRVRHKSQEMIGTRHRHHQLTPTVQSLVIISPG